MTDIPKQPQASDTPTMSYADFPKCTKTAPGMKTVPGHYDAIGCGLFENVEYACRGGQSLYLQVVVPMQQTQPDRKFPLVLYVPGSGWRKQNVFFAVPMLSHFAMRGYTLALVEYRGSEVAGFPAQVQDTKAAIRFMKKNAERFHADPAQTFIWGGSSGGHTALLAGLTDEENPELDCEDYRDVSTSVQGVIDYFGAVDVGQMHESTLDRDSPDSSIGMMLGGVRVSEHPERIPPTVVTNYIKPEKPIPPLLIMHGNKDRAVPFEQSLLLYNDMRAKGKDVELYMLDGADHSGPAFWAKENLDIVESFVRRVIADNEKK